MAKPEKPPSKRRSKPIPSRDKAIDIEEIKRAVKALPGRPPGVEASALAMRRDMLALRRSLAKRLAPLIVDGVDVTKAKPILADYEKKRKRLLESKKSEVEKAMSALADSRSEAMAGQRRALEVLATPGLPFTPTSFTLSPFLIWATSPSNMLVDSHADPVLHSWAKISLSRTYVPPDETYGSELTFFYLWSNPSEYYAIVNANCQVVLTGTCVADANTGILGGGVSWVTCGATLNPLEWWNLPQPALPPGSFQPEQAWYVEGFPIYAEGGGFWSVDDSAVNFLTGAARDLHFVLFAIPPGALAVFEVRVRFNWSVDDGSIAIDFASKPNYKIASLLQLELLTAPSALGALDGGQSPPNSRSAQSGNKRRSPTARRR
jgi:hypothetical protein